jgi:hypothetical protein
MRKSHSRRHNYLRAWAPFEANNPFPGETPPNRYLNPDDDYTPFKYPPGTIPVGIPKPPNHYVNTDYKPTYFAPNPYLKM